MDDVDLGVDDALAGNGARSNGYALDVEEFRRLGYRAVDLAASHLAGMRDRPVYQRMGDEDRRRLLDMPMPEAGSGGDEILEAFAQYVLPHPMGNGHPRFFGWINSPPAPLGILAELLAAAMNPSCAGGDHAAIYLEHGVVRWLMDLLDFPTEGSAGILVSGGSMASLTCLTAARHWAAESDGWDVRVDGVQGVESRFILYLAAEGHTTLRKAAELLGLGESSVRIIPVDDTFRMDVDALRSTIAADIAAGNHPFCVAASAGTASAGAIDRFDAIADVCEEHGLWMHVDGAYGGIGVLDPGLADAYAGMNRARSIAVDPHKWLSVPVECGCALVRDGELLRRSFSLVPPYVQTEEGKGIGGLPWFSEYGFQQTRGFRALKLWMTLKQAGREGLVELISRHNRLARYLASLVADAPDLELLAPVQLSIVCFRYVPESLRGDERALDALNKGIMEQVQSEGEAFLTQSILRGHFALRACVLHYGSTEEDIEALVATVRSVGERLNTS